MLNLLLASHNFSGTMACNNGGYHTRIGVKLLPSSKDIKNARNEKEVISFKFKFVAKESLCIIFSIQHV